MATFTQKTSGKGMAAALVRSKERHETPLTLYHNFDEERIPLLLRQLQNMMPMGVSLVAAPPSPTTEALVKSEAHIERLIAERKEMQQKLNAMQAQLDAARGTAREMVINGVKWISLTAATKVIHRSYATLWRAQHDGRLDVMIIGGKERNQMLCNPSSYRAKVGAVGGSPRE